MLLDSKGGLGKGVEPGEHELNRSRKACLLGTLPCKRWLRGISPHWIDVTIDLTAKVCAVEDAEHAPTKFFENLSRYFGL